MIFKHLLTKTVESKAKCFFPKIRAAKTYAHTNLYAGEMKKWAWNETSSTIDIRWQENFLVDWFFVIAEAIWGGKCWFLSRRLPESFQKGQDNVSQTKFLVQLYVELWVMQKVLQFYYRNTEMKFRIWTEQLKILKTSGLGMPNMSMEFIVSFFEQMHEI